MQVVAPHYAIDAVESRADTIIVHALWNALTEYPKYLAQYGEGGGGDHQGKHESDEGVNDAVY